VRKTSNYVSRYARVIGDWVSDYFVNLAGIEVICMGCDDYLRTYSRDSAAVQKWPRSYSLQAIKRRAIAYFAKRN
jgi:hypothetical protein